MKPDQQLEGLQDSTIVMVDDDETILDVLEIFLRRQGYSNILPTTDPRVALDLIRQERPEVVLLDLIMPEVGGLEILKFLRADEVLEHTPVIILTSATDSETKLSALELGATDFLGKPVDQSELALRLRNTLTVKAYQDRLAYYDGLTGLPNRRLLVEQLESTLVQIKSEATECAVLHLGLDRFKNLNDSLGRRVGDEILKGCAGRLAACMASDDLVDRHGRGPTQALSRVGGDEFTAFLTGVGCLERSARIARRMIAELAKPFRANGKDLYVTASLGISHFPHDGEDVEALLRTADTAMSQAKQKGRNAFQFYSDSLNFESTERLQMEYELRLAAERKELFLHYQPKVDTCSGQIVGAEALMRWKHSELGFVSPEKFIPIAEDAGLITELGAWALRVACEQNKAWQDAGFEPIRMAVNVSGQQFRTGLVETVREALESSGLSAEYLVLELTESTIMEDPEETVKMLIQIEQLGIRLSVDDFGTGYSSLAYLKSFPLRELKIDRSFINGLPENSDGAAIVKAIIAMAHSLDLSVVAEGIETQEQHEFLKERGCDQCQGYFFGKPVAASEWTALLSAKAKK